MAGENAQNGGLANSQETGEQPSIEKQILKNFKEEELNPESYENLIIDDMQLKEGFKAEDRTYLNQFKQLKKLSINSVHLKSLENLP
mmetsp:Transcript_11070/g.18528  ORF Transcript_11070/g.18528 Transcript_11070/m.18528 type:complete len:87 (+) Transcript_11070:33-293(+)